MEQQSSQSPFQSPEFIKLRNYLIVSVNRELELNPPSLYEREDTVRKLLLKAYESTKLNLNDSLKEQLIDNILDDILGYGPIQSFLNDSTISEVMVNGPSQVYIERNGLLEKTDAKFENDEHIRQIINRIVLPLGRAIDEDRPSVDARLPDGSRVNAIIPPVAIDGPSITIRKFEKGKLGIDKLIEYGSITQGMADLLRACVISKLNIIVSGGTGAGKTTLLNVLSGFIPESERIVTIEDSAELKLQQDHVVRLETKPANADGRFEMAIRDLVRNSLRMRPDRIVVGEVRGGEAIDMLQAMNTGHEGSLTTLHANSPRDAISRLETMSLMAGMDLPLKVIRHQIASAIDLIVQQTRFRDGTRKVTSITEVVGMEGETVTMTDIFKFQQSGVGPDGEILGELRSTNIRPMFYPRLETSGIKLGPEVFGANIGEILNKGRRR